MADYSAINFTGMFESVKQGVITFALFVLKILVYPLKLWNGLPWYVQWTIILLTILLCVRIFRYIYDKRAQILGFDD